MLPRPGGWLSRCCAYQGSFLKSSKSVVNSLSISAKVPVFQGFSEIIKVVLNNSNVTWAQIITVLIRFVEPQEYSLQHIRYSGWADQAIQTAVALGWIEDNAESQPHAAISCGDLVKLEWDSSAIQIEKQATPTWEIA